MIESDGKGRGYGGGGGGAQDIVNNTVSPEEKLAHKNAKKVQTELHIVKS